MPKKVRPIPKGYASVTPALNQDDAARTIEFCKRAFGAKVRMNMTSPDGKIVHAELQIGDSIVMLNDAMGNEPSQPAGLFLYVQDVDKTFAKAVKAGGTALMPPQDMFWGDRFGRVQDPSGNRWGIATHREDVTPREMKKRAAAAFSGGGPQA
jgi:PhnB protein